MHGKGGLHVFSPVVAGIKKPPPAKQEAAYEREVNPKGLGDQDSVDHVDHTVDALHVGSDDVG